ncbi:MAG: ATP-binding protein [Thiogranum sp.]|nr:ATP-binding protein [Thiogranum sp.]
MTDVTLHITENTDHAQREKLRDSLLAMNGVMAAAYHDERPHLMIIEYDPNIVEAVEFVEHTRREGLHSQLVGM